MERELDSQGRRSPKGGRGRLVLAVVVGIVTFLALVVGPAQGMALGKRAAALAQTTDLAIAKTGPATVLPGSTISYTLSYTNQGGVAENVLVTDTLPSGVSYVAASPPGTMVSPGVYTWSLGTVITGTTGTIVVTATVDSGLAAGSVLTNTVQIGTTTPESDATNNSATAAAVVVRADLWVAKTSLMTTVFPGGRIQYTVSYANRGGADAQNVRITDTLPLRTTYYDDSSPWRPPTVVGRTVVWDVGALAAGQSGSFSLFVDVDPTTPPGTHLVNAIAMGTSTPESSYANNQDQTDPTIVQAADVEVTKIAPPEARPASLITYTIAYTNTGNFTADNVVITDTLPLSVTYFSATPLPSQVQEGRIVRWSRGNLGVGVGGAITLVGQVSGMKPSGTTLTNTVEIATTTPESDKGDNTDLAATTVAPDVPHTIIMVAHPTQISVGGETSIITATVRDQWGNPVSDGTLVTFAISGPGGVNPTSDLTTQGVAVTTLTSGTTPGTAIISATADSRVGSASVEIVPGPPASVAVDAEPESPTVDETSLVTGVARDRYDNPVADGTVMTFATSLGAMDPVTNTTSGGVATSILSSHLVGTAQVTVTAESAAGFTSVAFAPGAPYTVTATAQPPGIPVDGAASLIQARVTDQYGNPVADGTTVAFTTTLGVISPLTTTTADGLATATLTSGSAAGTAVVTAQVDSRQGQITVAFLPADVTIHKSVNLSQAIPGQPLTYVLSYANYGVATARGVSITDELDPRLIPLGYVDSGATITRTEGITYAWRVEDLSPGEGGTITITAQLDPSIIWPPSENVWNQATITTTTAEGGPAPNQSTKTTLVLTADLYITKEIVPELSSFTPGGTIVYRIGFGNTGWAVAQGIRITDTLPLSTTWDWDDSSYEVGLTRIEVGPQVVWTRGGSVGANESFRLWVKINDDAPGGLELTNAITATTGTPESDYTNNRDFASKRVQGTNLSLAKSGPMEVRPGRLITYTIVYSNTGTVTAQNVVITDTLPPGVTFVGASPPPSSISGQAHFWSVGPLAPEAAGTIRLTGRVTTVLPAGLILINQAEIGTATPESYRWDNVDRTTTLIVPDLPYAVTVEAASDSLPADGLSTAVITATVRDEWGNLVADGTSVAFTTTLGTITPTLGTTSQGVATTTLTAGTVAGTALVTATADSRLGFTQVTLLPGPPSILTLAAYPTSLLADGLSTATITATVRDEWGNLVADGTSVAFTTTLGTITPTLGTTSQ
ncbi:MAG: invasin domain 3-containing protein, partial [Anaerolineae bacterium]